MLRHIPNCLTGLRLLLAFVFFAILSYYQYEGRGYPVFMTVAFFVYLVALLTDFFDGYLARRWKVEGAFGRVVDPFVDKVLVLGSFIFFAGKNFIIPPEGSDPVRVFQTITGVAPFMVVIMLARELLVTSLRATSESAGQNFGAAFSGKLKMVLQSITILVILVFVTYRPWLLQNGYEPAARVVRNVFIWATVVVTVLSGLLYIHRAIALYRSSLAPEQVGK